MLKLYKFIFNKFLRIFAFGFVMASGRNFFGRICVHHQGGGHKFNYLIIDKFRYINEFGFIIRILKNYYRTAFVGLVIYDNGLTSFIMLTEGIFKGSRIFSGSDLLLYSNLKFGSTQKLFNISLFENISFIELFPYSGIKLARAAGVSSKIISKDNEKSVLKLTSGWVISLSNFCLASLGISSNIGWNYEVIKKSWD